MIAIDVRGLSKSYGARSVLTKLSVRVEAGEWLGVLGPNGSGKSTLLHLISGVIQPDGGEVLLGEKPMARYGRKALARLLAVLAQEALPPLGFTVREVVEMGRYPYQNWLGDESGDAALLIERIMKDMQLEPLAGRSVEQLSGGERQRVALGKAMAQEPKVLLLDEPTTYLDIGYQVEMLDRVQAWRQESGMTVVSVLHDLNLASLYCDRLLLVHEGREAAFGTPIEVLRADVLERVYGTRPHVLPHPVSGVPQILLDGGTKR